ncbi:MAG: helix-hairpin-helix domain-containing protein [Clostridiales bacterium]
MSRKLKINSTFCIFGFLVLATVFGLGFLSGKILTEKQNLGEKQHGDNSAVVNEPWVESAPQGDGAKNKDANKNKKVNLNTGDYYELISVDGIGPNTAKKILKYRDDYGGFNELKDLVVLGLISQELADKIKDFVIVEFT